MAFPFTYLHILYVNSLNIKDSETEGKRPFGDPDV